VYLADNPEGYTELVQKALSENDPSLEKERIRFAATHSWENCVSKLYEAVADFSQHNHHSK
jgi:teichuronic acid biosynthesis glycosyltransferase TuaH